METVGAPYYQTTGKTAGKYNASSSASTLSYSVKISTTHKSGWTFGGGLSVKAAVVTINGNTSYDTSTSNTTGITVTDSLKVSGKHYGYVTPKAEFRKFHILKQHFSECVSKNACTPKP